MYGIGVFFALRHAMRAFREREYAFCAPLTPERVLMELHGERVGELRRQAEVGRSGEELPDPVG